MVLEFLSYQFGVRAMIGGLIIAVTCSSLGVFLVLRKLSLIADGLSHVAFGGIAFGLFAGIYPLYTAVVRGRARIARHTCSRQIEGGL